MDLFKNTECYIMKLPGLQFYQLRYSLIFNSKDRHNFS